MSKEEDLAFLIKTGQIKEAPKEKAQPKKEEEYLFTVREQDDIYEEWLIAPTFSQVFRWFREKYDLYSWIQLHNGYINDSFYPELPITFSIMDRKTGNESYERDIPHNYLYKTNEEAELACLQKLIEIVEQKQKEI